MVNPVDLIRKTRWYQRKTMKNLDFLYKTSPISRGFFAKQTQFMKGWNEHKVNYNKGIREIYWIGHLVKTNPIQSQSQTKSGLFAYGARDCHGPSGLAMTSGSLCLSGFVAMRTLKKQACPERSRMEPIYSYCVLRTACCVLRKGVWKNKANFKMGKIALIQ